MAGKGAPEDNQYARKAGTGKTISLYLTADDMALLRLILTDYGKDTSDEECVKLAKKAAKAGINSLLLPEKNKEVRRFLEGRGEQEHV